MLELKLLPGDKRLAKFTKLHWLLFWLIIEKVELRRLRALANLLGVELGQERIPLAAFINPELYKQLVSKVEVQVGDSDYVDELSPEELKYLADELDKLAGGK